MKYFILICMVGAVLFGIAVYRFSRAKPAGKSTRAAPVREIEVDDFIVVPSSVSRERVTNAGLSDEGSEDKRQLLTVPKLRAAPAPGEERDYRPSDSIAWVLDVTFAGDPALQQTQLAELFGPEWSRAHGRPTVYGWSPESKHWTFLFSADAPTFFTKLCFGWDLIDPLDEEMQIDANALEGFKQATILAAESLGTPKATLNRTAGEAVTLAAQLSSLKDECQREVVIVLKARNERPFKGRDIWDVMRCLGLEWGDGDLFHWRNDSALGGDFLFSVETSTQPGYFIPEQIAAGGVEVGDLVFGYSIPRSAAPEHVFESLLRAVEYARSRLGGTIMDRFEKPFDAESVRAEIKRIVQRLRQDGMESGDDAALQLF